MSTTLHLIIATPLRTVYDARVDQVTVTTSNGELTILPNHIPLVTTLKIGQVMVRKGSQEIYHAIDGGILEVRPNNELVILSDRSENATEIDISRAEEALVRAQKIMEQKDGDREIDYESLERDIAKQMNRLKLAKKGERK